MSSKPSRPGNGSAAARSRTTQRIADVEAFPETLVTAFSKVAELRYGEIPELEKALSADPQMAIDTVRVS